MIHKPMAHVPTEKENNMAFFNRASELNTIKRSLSSSQAELVIVYGRRGSGKSELLIQAITDHHALYYQATTELLLRCHRRIFTLAFLRGGFVSLAVASILILLPKPLTRRIASS